MWQLHIVNCQLKHHSYLSTAKKLQRQLYSIYMWMSPCQVCTNQCKVKTLSYMTDEETAGCHYVNSLNLHQKCAISQFKDLGPQIFCQLSILSSQVSFQSVSGPIYFMSKISLPTAFSTNSIIVQFILYPLKVLPVAPATNPPSWWDCSALTTVIQCNICICTALNMTRFVSV